MNKYEAEAYAALLRHGQLTGYELGKRSEVPLSRSYEVLERLVGKGLALVQPGDPPRYAAEAPDEFFAVASNTMRRVLVDIAQNGGVTAQTSDSFMNSVTTMSSAHDQRRVLTALAGTPHEKLSVRLLLSTVCVPDRPAAMGSELATAITSLL